MSHISCCVLKLNTLRHWKNWLFKTLIYEIIFFVPFLNIRFLFLLWNCLVLLLKMMTEEAEKRTTKYQIESEKKTHFLIFIYNLFLCLHSFYLFLLFIFFLSFPLHSKFYISKRKKKLKLFIIDYNIQLSLFIYFFLNGTSVFIGLILLVFTFYYLL